MQPTPDLWVLVALVGLPFAAAAATPAVARQLGNRTAYYAAAVAAVCLALVVSLAGTHGGASVTWVGPLEITLGFYVDGLATFVGALASGVGVLVFVYSAGYMREEPGQTKYYATMLAFMGSMLGVVYAGDLVVLFCFWELTSIASFLLVGHYSESRDSRYSARKAFLVTVGGGLFMLVGFVLLASVAGTYSLTAMLADPAATRAAVEQAGLLLPIVSLVGVGAAAKSAQFPLHVWLPNAMAAPTPVSAFLHSATMVKAGVFLLGRMRPILVGDDWTHIFVTLGLVTMLIAAVLAVCATELKELLAYSTVSHLGLIVAGFGFSSALGAETGVFHILNHAAFKAALFLVAGIVAHEAGTRQFDELGGLWRDLPVVAGVTVIAALGMGGVPPFNGFYSKEFLFEAAYHLASHDGGLTWVYPVIAVVGSVFTLVYSLRFLSVFFGQKPESLGHVHSAPWSMNGPPVLLAGIAGVIGLGGVTAALGYPLYPLEKFVGHVIASTLSPGVEHLTFHYAFPTYLTPAVAMSALTLVGGAFTYFVWPRIQAAVTGTLAAVPPLGADWWYDTLVFGANRASTATHRTLWTDTLRTYASWTLAGSIALGGFGYLATSVAIPFGEMTLGIPLAIILAVAALAALAAIRAPSHVAGVLALSVVGFGVTVFFVLAGAPDVALTQVVVETVTFVVFLIVLDRLPSYYGRINRSRAAQDAVLSVLVGGFVTVTTLVATGANPDSIASYFVENAVPEAGGHNLVNVILVDFRGIDTMGEISVIAMAAVAVLTLVVMRERGETP
ncbi:hydrogen gas-evolving membrane-bound hydrogenase subunit E [Halarchaeum sp. P4]|uniref:hydrogen gas-evolving membrane-bound hydrogenase subunit E n=1 Tax=Halarchaeum sp. P4 TaxID=3421639 RepID=UPI003EB8F756